jgi:CRP-like cAMP-binding protein
MPRDLVDRILQEIRERKEASRAAYEESQRLQRALAALDQQDGRSRGPETRRRGRGGASTARRGPRAAPGANRAAILAAVRERPGVTAGELAAATGIARATVSSTVARLATSGALERTELPGGGVGFRLPAESNVPSAGADVPDAAG